MGFLLPVFSEAVASTSHSLDMSLTDNNNFNAVNFNTLIINFFTWLLFKNDYADLISYTV